MAPLAAPDDLPYSIRRALEAAGSSLSPTASMPESAFTAPRVDAGSSSHRAAANHEGRSSRTRSRSGRRVSSSRAVLRPNRWRSRTTANPSCDVPSEPRGPPRPLPVCTTTEAGTDWEDLDMPYSPGSSDSSEIDRRALSRHRAGTPPWLFGSRSARAQALARDGTMARPPDTSAALSAPLEEQQEEERPAEEDPMLDFDLSDDADATYAAFSSPTRADIGDMPPATEDASWSSLGFSDSTEDGLGRERQTRD